MTSLAEIKETATKLLYFEHPLQGVSGDALGYFGVGRSRESLEMLWGHSGAGESLGIL